LGGLIWKLSTEEEMEETVKKIVNLIANYNMETAGILVFESVKPVVRLGAGLSRVFIAPWLHLIGVNTRPVINTLEEPKNVEKILQLLEKSLQEKKENKNQETEKEGRPGGEEVKIESKKGWRRFLPF
jgi:hypothetical protein